MTFQQNIGVRTDEKDEDKVPLLQKQSETFHGNKSNYTNISEVWRLHLSYEILYSSNYKMLPEHLLQEQALSTNQV